jgi:hypothetical protein
VCSAASRWKRRGAPRRPLGHTPGRSGPGGARRGGDLGCSRERLLALLWPENDEASARHGLRDALHAIRQALGPGALPSVRRLVRGHAYDWQSRGRMRRSTSAERQPRFYVVTSTAAGVAFFRYTPAIDRWATLPAHAHAHAGLGTV